MYDNDCNCFVKNGRFQKTNARPVYVDGYFFNSEHSWDSKSKLKKKKKNGYPGSNITLKSGFLELHTELASLGCQFFGNHSQVKEQSQDFQRYDGENLDFELPLEGRRSGIQTPLYGMYLLE